MTSRHEGDKAMKTPATKHVRRTGQSGATIPNTPQQPAVPEQRDCYPWNRIREIERSLKLGDELLKAYQKHQRTRPALLEELWLLRREIQEEKEEQEFAEFRRTNRKLAT